MGSPGLKDVLGLPDKSVTATPLTIRASICACPKTGRSNTIILIVNSSKEALLLDIPVLQKLLHSLEMIQIKCYFNKHVLMVHNISLNSLAKRKLQIYFLKHVKQSKTRFQGKADTAT
jgi:hypothetical protein